MLGGCLELLCWGTGLVLLYGYGVSTGWFVSVDEYEFEKEVQGHLSPTP